MVDTGKRLADLFTKALPHVQFLACIRGILKDSATGIHVNTAFTEPSDFAGGGRVQPDPTSALWRGVCEQAYWKAKADISLTSSIRVNKAAGRCHGNAHVRIFQESAQSVSCGLSGSLCR